MKRDKTNTKATTVISTDDSGNFRNAILSALGKDQKCQIFSPYGLCSNPPDGSLGITFNIQGIAANTVAIVDDPKNRKKGLAKWEVALVNYDTESFIYLKEDGGIDIETAEGSKVQLLPDGTVNIEATTAFNVVAPIIDLSADTNLILSAPVIDIIGDTLITMTAPIVTITGATAVNIVSSTIINLTSAVLASTGVLTALDFATAIIATLNAHGHAPGTFKDAEARPITGKSGAPS